MHLDRDSHRFFIAPNLIAGLHGSFDWWRAPYLRKGAIMLDVILLALGLAFFALSIGYAFACDRL